MKLVFAVRGVYPEHRGGAPLVIYNLISHLADYQDVEIDVYHPGTARCFNQVNIHEFGLETGSANFKFKRIVASALRNHGQKYDAGLTDGYSMVFYLHQRVFPIIYHHHSFRWFQFWDYGTFLRFMPLKALKTVLSNWVKRKLSKYMAWHSDCIVSQGVPLTELFQRTLRIDPAKILHAPSPPHTRLETREGSTDKGQETAFLFVGELVHYKGVIYLIEAFNQLIQDDVRLDIVGDGSLREKLRSKCQNPKVKFLGHVQDKTHLQEIYRNSDCFIFPSLSEGSPLVLPEALSFGLPIISTRVGGTGQFLTETNAIEIKPADPEGITEAVQSFSAQSSQERQSMRNASRQIFESLPDWNENTRLFYERFKELSDHRFAMR